MFVFRRSVAPAFGFMVMNRLAIDHFFESLVPEMEVQITEAYIYYRNPRGFLFFFSLSLFSFSSWILFFFSFNSAGEIHGLWFYDPQEKEKFGDLLRQ